MREDPRLVILIILAFYWCAGEKYSVCCFTLVKSINAKSLGNENLFIPFPFIDSNSTAFSTSVTLCTFCWVFLLVGFLFVLLFVFFFFKNNSYSGSSISCRHVCNLSQEGMGCRSSMQHCLAQCYFLSFLLPAVVAFFSHSGFFWRELSWAILTAWVCWFE